jgi:hypothetical protein
MTSPFDARTDPTFERWRQARQARELLAEQRAATWNCNGRLIHR